MKFRLVDRIQNYNPLGKITTLKAISFEEYSLLKVWGRKGNFPETLMLQVAVESASLMKAANSGFKSIGVLHGIRQVCFSGVGTPGGILTTVVETEHAGSETCLERFYINSEEHRLVTGLIELTCIPLAHCFEPEAYKIMWEELNGRPS